MTSEPILTYPGLSMGRGCRLDASLQLRGEGTIEFGHYVSIGPGVLIDLGDSGKGKVRIGHRAKLKGHTYIRCYNGHCMIGDRATVGEFVVLYGHGGIDIEEAAGVGPHVSIFASTHIIDSDLPIRLQGEIARGVRIEKGVWLGSGSRILDGVTIGRDTAVGANSVVLNDLESHSVYAGAPARLLRRRGSRGRNLALYDTAHEATSKEGDITQ